MKYFYSLLVALVFTVSAKSQCTFPIPYSENFDGPSWVVPASASQPGSIQACWGRVPSATGYLWVPGPSVTVNNFTGPLSDKSGSGKFMYTESSGFTTPPYVANLLTPFIDLSGSTAPEVSFWYYMYGSQIGSLTVQVSTGGAWNTISTTSGQQQTNNTAAWVKITQSLSAYVGDTIRIRFVGQKNSASSQSRIAIDEITVAEQPTCAPVANVYTSGTTANSTMVSWTAGSASSTSWEIEYGPAGFTPGSGTVVTVSANPATISGLSGSTMYSIYVREVCSLTDKSPWEGPVFATTLCSGPIIAPFTENFDGPGWVQYVSTQNFGSVGPCWVTNPTPAIFNYMWLVNPNLLFSNNTGPSSDHTTGNGKYMATQTVAGSNTFAVLRSPQIDLSAVSNPELIFWYHMFGSGISMLEVEAKPVVGGAWTNIHTETGQQQTSSAAPWQSVSVSLSAYANQTIYIRFKGTRNSTSTQSAKIAIDDLSIVPGSNCPKPGSFSASNIQSTSLTLTWTGVVGQYEVKQGPVGFNPSLTGTSIPSTGLSQVITGLTSNTTYQYYVRKICTSDTSNWEGPLTVTTLCFATAPYTQNFDGANWVPPINFSNDNGSISNCWNRSLIQTYIWTPGPPPFASFATGPSADHTTGTATGKYMFTDSPGFGGTPPITATFVSELIDLSPLDTPELSFWYHMFGNQIGTLKVEINNGSGWTQIFTKTGQQQTSKTDDWDEAVINLVNYVNDTIQLRFTGSKAVNGFNSEIAIDDVDIHELPSCPKPSNLAVLAPTFNSAIVSWTTGGATSWIIKYGAPGFTSGTFTSASSNPFTLTGLSPSTNYEIWIRDSCAVGDVSQWVGPVFFETSCLPTVAPYSQNFNGTTFVPWTFVAQEGIIDPCFRRSAVTEYYWVPGPPPNNSFNTGPSTGYGGSGKYLYTRTSLFQADLQTSFSTPWIDKTSLTAPELRFQYHMYGASIDKLEVRAQGYDGTITLLTVITGQQQTSKTAAWIQKVQTLATVNSDTFRLLFTGYRTVNGFQAEIAVDEIEVSNPQNCVAPSALASSNITTNSVQLSWTSNASSAGTNIEYGPTGFLPGSGTTIFGVSSPHVVTGLNSSTTYQFYIQDSCAWGGLTSWVGPISATTLSCPAITASFTANTATGLSVAFNSSASTGTITNYAWDFGDGNSATTASPTHVYAAGGTYNVSLIISNTCGAIDTFLLSISVCDVLSSQFTNTSNGLMISFNASASTGTGLTYDWLFGDGTTGSGVTINHLYAVDGAYNVSLIVTDACGNVDTLTQSINVCNPAVAVLNYTQNGLDVTFDGTSSTGAVQWQWNFGDGNTSTSATQLHTYASTGTYLITLYTTNLCGDRDTATITLTLCNAPEAKWTYQVISSGGGGMTVQFDGSASIGANSFQWTFGDGGTNNSSAIPVHTYAVPGLFYVVTLTVSNNCGDENSLTSSLAAIGIEDLESAGLIVFPNPIDDALLIHVPEFLTINDLRLVNALGQLVKSDFTIENGVVIIDSSNLSEGNYFLNLQTNAGEAVYQLVVKH